MLPLPTHLLGARIVLREPKRLLDWAAKAPSVEKIARMYWVDREERRMKEREANAQAAQDERAESCCREPKRPNRKKREEANRIKVEKRRAAAAPRLAQRQRQRSQHVSRRPKLRRCHGPKEMPQTVVRMQTPLLSHLSPHQSLGLRWRTRLAVSKAANLAGKKVMEEEQARIMKAEFAEAEKAAAEAAQLSEIIKERERLAEQQERRDNRISGRTSRRRSKA